MLGAGYLEDLLPAIPIPIFAENQHFNVEMIPIFRKNKIREIWVRVGIKYEKFRCELVIVRVDGHLYLNDLFPKNREFLIRAQPVSRVRFKSL